MVVLLVKSAVPFVRISSPLVRSGNCPEMADGGMFDGFEDLDVAAVMAAGARVNEESPVLGARTATTAGATRGAAPRSFSLVRPAERAATRAAASSMPSPPQPAPVHMPVQPPQPPLVVPSPAAAAVPSAARAAMRGRSTTHRREQAGEAETKANHARPKSAASDLGTRGHGQTERATTEREAVVDALAEVAQMDLTKLLSRLQLGRGLVPSSLRQPRLPKPVPSELLASGATTSSGSSMGEAASDSPTTLGAAHPFRVSPPPASATGGDVPPCKKPGKWNKPSRPREFIVAADPSLDFSFALPPSMVRRSPDVLRDGFGSDCEEGVDAGVGVDVGVGAGLSPSRHSMASTVRPSTGNNVPAEAGDEAGAGIGSASGAAMGPPAPRKPLVLPLEGWDDDRFEETMAVMEAAAEKATAERKAKALETAQQAAAETAGAAAESSSLPDDGEVAPVVLFNVAKFAAELGAGPSKFDDVATMVTDVLLSDIPTKTEELFSAGYAFHSSTDRIQRDTQRLTSGYPASQAVFRVFRYPDEIRGASRFGRAVLGARVAVVHFLCLLSHQAWRRWSIGTPSSETLRGRV